MKRKVICCAMAILLVATLMLPVSADFDASNREAVAVVFTCMELDGGDYPFGWGTGFFVGTEGENPQYLITNHHVISSFLEYGAGELIDVYVDDVPMSGRSKIRIYYNSSDYDEAYLVDYDESRDIALLKLGSPTDERKPLPLYVPNDDMVGATPIGSSFADYGMNAWSVGIELVHVGGSGDYPPEQLEALDRLVAYIDAYYGFESEITDHKAWRSGNSDTSPEFAGYLANYQDHRTHD